MGSQFGFGDHGTVSLKGFETPVQAWQVLSIGSSASRFEAHRSAQLVNFIGREDEVSLLYGRWREVVGGEGQVLLLSGEAGIGKSRIIQILCDRIADEHHNIIRYQCSPYHTNTALYPAINYLRQAAGFASNDSSNAKLNKLNVMAVEAGVENQETVSLIADLLSIRGDHRNPPSNVSSEKRKEMTLEALVHHVQSLAVRGSVLFIVEDAHWIDPTTRDLLTRNHRPHPANTRVVADHISTQLQARLVGTQSRHVSNAQSASTSALYRTRFSDHRGKSASARGAAGHSGQDRWRAVIY